ncbi:S8 family peptidase [Bacteriovorax sp. DB6_IX]|uniref:S8 family peptidase n=1 Tax=Bacteriovorax sp. DB6_IX TaxID=1353530 RepID=UPI00038A126E|nr:S8 family peptidase [Bacteriovorax sp. DB6_IX]EQC51993.1 peptidase, S8/S53 family [Bacteriovorax sp. DB6_IX]
MKKMFLSLAVLCSASVFAQNFNGYIVKLKNGAESLPIMKNMGDVKSVTTSFGSYAVIKGQDLDNKSLGFLKSDPNVEYVEKNWIVTLDSTVHTEKETNMDTGFSKQWGLLNDGRNSGGWFSRGKEGEDVNAVKAWEITKGSNEIVVAVIDTGVDHTHPDLKENMWVNDAEKNGIEGVDDDGNGYVDDIYGYDFANKDGDPMDGHSHGTHCAGNIGASHNGTGVMGVMANVKMMGIKFLTDRGSGETIDAISSIEYAIKNGAHIMSNSWGGGERSEALKEAIVAAKDAGILFVAAAGNSRSDNDARPTYPANYDVENVITVGAMDGKGNRSSFSNYGKTSVHVFAPGSNIYSTTKNGGYQKMSGTSMATPIVSGVLGLLLANEPGITVEDAKRRLIESTVKNTSLTDYAVGGRVDANALLRNQKN